MFDQSRPPDEIVVVDDGSLDDTLRHIERASERAPCGVRLYVNPERLGVVGNFSRALRECTGDLVAFADQDDRWHRDKLAKLETALLEAAAAVSFCDAMVVDESGEPTGRRHWDVIGFDRRERASLESDPLAPLLRRNPVSGAAMLVRRVEAARLLPVSSAGLHDQWISFLLVALGQRLVAVDEPLLDYRIHGGNQVGAPSRGRLRQLRERLRRTPSRDELALFRDLRGRAEALGAREEVLRRIDAKVDHLARRSALPRSRLARLAPCARELLGGRYGDYSRGVESFVFDVVFR